MSSLTVRFENKECSITAKMLSKQYADGYKKLINVYMKRYGCDSKESSDHKTIEYRRFWIFPSGKTTITLNSGMSYGLDATLKINKVQSQELQGVLENYASLEGNIYSI